MKRKTLNQKFGKSFAIFTAVLVFISSFAFTTLSFATSISQFDVLENQQLVDPLLSPNDIKTEDGGKSFFITTKNSRQQSESFDPEINSQYIYKYPIGYGDITTYTLSKYGDVPSHGLGKLEVVETGSRQVIVTSEPEDKRIIRFGTQDVLEGNNGFIYGAGETVVINLDNQSSLKEQCTYNSSFGTPGEIKYYEDGNGFGEPGFLIVDNSSPCFYFLSRYGENFRYVTLNPYLDDSLDAALKTLFPNSYNISRSKIGLTNIEIVDSHYIYTVDVTSNGSHYTALLTASIDSPIHIQSYWSPQSCITDEDAIFNTETCLYGKPGIGYIKEFTATETIYIEPEVEEEEDIEPSDEPSAEPGDEEDEETATEPGDEEDEETAIEPGDTEGVEPEEEPGDTELLSSDSSSAEYYTEIKSKTYYYLPKQLISDEDPLSIWAIDITDPTNPQTVEQIEFLGTWGEGTKEIVELEGLDTIVVLSDSEKYFLVSVDLSSIYNNPTSGGITSKYEAFDELGYSGFNSITAYGDKFIVSGFGSHGFYYTGNDGYIVKMDVTPGTATNYIYKKPKVTRTVVADNKTLTIYGQNVDNVETVTFSAAKLGTKITQTATPIVVNTSSAVYKVPDLSYVGQSDYAILGEVSGKTKTLFQGVYTYKLSTTNAKITFADVFASSKTKKVQYGDSDGVISSKKTTINPVSSSRSKAIIWLAQAGITAGAGVGRVVGKAVQEVYKPEEAVNRGTMAQFLLKLSGAKATTTTKSSFADVKIDPNTSDAKTTFSVKYSGDKKSTQVSYVSQARLQAIEWLYKNGITGGSGSTAAGKATFSPQEAVNRGSMAQFLQKYLEATKTTVKSAGFADVKTGEGTFKVKYAGAKKATKVSKLSASRVKAINWLAQVGITGGAGKTSAGKTAFKPAEIVTRGSMAQFLKKAYDLVIAGKI